MPLITFFNTTRFFIVFFVNSQFAQDIILVTCRYFSSTKQRIQFWTCSLWLLGKRWTKTMCASIYGAQYGVIDVYSLPKQLYWRLKAVLYSMNYWFPPTQHRLTWRFYWIRYRRCKGESLSSFLCYHLIRGNWGIVTVIDYTQCITQFYQILAKKVKAIILMHV